MTSARDSELRGDGAGSLSILRLPTSEPKEMEAIRQALANRKGVSRVDIDHLKFLVVVEYDSEEVTLEQVRAIVGLPRREPLES